MLPLLLFLACTGATDSEPVVESAAIDADADGFFAAEDCDDQEAAIHPGATEVPYDGADNDCDPGT
ncbi:MAG TPA: putative metal-binding motif-containing protein, partial [Myxococcota bacterium]|nr:putative metal-binding motif-containing protein [Myxococcota bacterium]